MHKDSLGNEQLIRPGALNLMTAGRAIAHSEETPPRHSGKLHGLQLWVALPDAYRHIEPAFDHHPELPVAAFDGCHATVLIGELAAARSPAKAYLPIVGAELVADRDGRCSVPLNPDFEHALLLIAGTAAVDDNVLDSDTLYYLGSGRKEIPLKHQAGTRLMLVGGTPFGESVLMWWNFVARTTEEIVAAREDWEEQRRFGEVRGYAGGRLSAPPFEARLKPSG